MLKKKEKKKGGGNLMELSPASFAAWGYLPQLQNS